MKRGEVWHGVGNGLDSECGVGNGLDRGRVDIVDDDKGMLVQEPNQPEYYNTYKQNTKSIQQHSSSSGKWTNRNHKMGYGLRASARN